MIRLLARSDPAVAERLANTCISYRQTAGTLRWQAAPQGGGHLKVGMKRSVEGQREGKKERGPGKPRARRS